MQAKFPVRHGGIGLRSPSDLVLPAYLFSRVACCSLISDVFNNTNGHWSEVEFVAATEAWVEKDLQIPSNLEFQRNWDESMCKAFYSQLEKTLNQHKLASLVSSSQNCSEAWLNCLPNSLGGAFNFLLTRVLKSIFGQSFEGISWWDPKESVKYFKEVIMEKI